jgi:hypothetical protein
MQLRKEGRISRIYVSIFVVLECFPVLVRPLTWCLWARGGPSESQWAKLQPGGQKYSYLSTETFNMASTAWMPDFVSPKLCSFIRSLLLQNTGWWQSSWQSTEEYPKFWSGNAENRECLEAAVGVVQYLSPLLSYCLSFWQTEVLLLSS